MVRMEVRCCCNPNKLLGWLQVPSSDVQQVVFPLNDDKLSTIALPVATFCQTEPGAEGKIRTESHCALKSAHLPIETFRLISGFEENTNEKQAEAAMMRLHAKLNPTTDSA